MKAFKVRQIGYAVADGAANPTEQPAEMSMFISPRNEEGFTVLFRTDNIVSILEVLGNLVDNGWHIHQMPVRYEEGDARYKQGFRYSFTVVIQKEEVKDAM